MTFSQINQVNPTSVEEYSMWFSKLSMYLQVVDTHLSRAIMLHSPYSTVEENLIAMRDGRITEATLRNWVTKTSKEPRAI
jgi:hypothetical protein